jgi:hypothetical protein
MVPGSFYARYASSGMLGRGVTRVLIQFVASSGDAGCSKRIFARFSLRRLSDRGYPHIACAIIKAGLGGDITSPEHWG